MRQALDETALLAQRIYPSALELGGLAALLRSAALNAGVPATVDVVAGSSYPPEVGMTVYLCWLALLARGARKTSDDQGARRPRTSHLRARRERRARIRISTGCRTASRPSAAG